MKRKLLATILAIGITTSAAFASKYLQKPQDGGTSNALIKLGDNVDQPVTTVTTVTIDDSGDLNTSGSLITTDNVGTAGTGVTATVYGDGHHQKIALALNSLTIGTFTNGTNFDDGTLNGAMGAAIYTFDDNGIYLVRATRIDVDLLASNGSILADTPDIGVGTAQAASTTAILLSAVTNGENIITGQTAGGLNGETAAATIAGTDFIIDTDAEGTIYLNIADKYAANANGSTLQVTNGDIILDVIFIQDTDVVN